MICRSFPSKVSGQFINTIDTMGTIGDGDGGGTTVFGTFLFRTTSSSVLVAFGD